MGSSSGTPAPTPQEQRDLHGGYWDSYSQWRGDAARIRDRDIQNAEASLAVAGVKQDSPMWTSRMAGIEETYQKSAGEYDEGPTRKMLNEYFEQQRGYQMNEFNRVALDAEYESTQSVRDPSFDGFRDSRRERAVYGGGVTKGKWSREELQGATMEEWYQKEYGDAKVTDATKASNKTANKNLQASDASSGQDTRRALTNEKTVSPWW